MEFLTLGQIFRVDIQEFVALIKLFFSIFLCHIVKYGLIYRSPLYFFWNSINLKVDFFF